VRNRTHCKQLTRLKQRTAKQEHLKRLESELLHLAGMHSDDENSESGQNEEDEQTFAPAVGRFEPSGPEVEEPEKPQPKRESTRASKPPTPKKLQSAMLGEIQRSVISDDEPEPHASDAPKEKRRCRRKRVLSAWGALQLSYNPVFHQDTRFEVCRYHQI
jgi:hypothetical protein